MSKIISIYGGYCAHDACSVYIEDGKIKSIIQEERPRRVKVYKDQYASPILSLHRIEKEFGVKLIRTVSSSDTTLHNPCANTGPFEVGGTGQVTVRTNINILDSPSTTSAVTYKTQIAAYDSNRGPFEAQFDETGGSAIDGTSYITLMEVVG